MLLYGKVVNAANMKDLENMKASNAGLWCYSSAIEKQNLASALVIASCEILMFWMYPDPGLSLLININQK